MSLNVGKLVGDLKRMTVTELRRKHSEVFGEQTRSHHKDYLVRRIAWRMQANVEGGLAERSKRIRERALEIANDADLRMHSPRPSRRPLKFEAPAETRTVRGVHARPDKRLPMPGAELTREYKGETIRVRVLPKGFEFEGECYRSLSAVAKAATGQHMNGFAFFNLAKPKLKARAAS
jgi:hypothetical protein